MEFGRAPNFSQGTDMPRLLGSALAIVALALAFPPLA